LVVISTCVIVYSRRVYCLCGPPRYLADVTAVRMTSRSLYSTFTGLVLFGKVIASHLDGLNSINQSCSQDGTV